jgi:hypothetical protein
MITTMHSDQNASPPRVEVITSVQRRRRWPTADGFVDTGFAAKQHNLTPTLDGLRPSPQQ